MALKIIYQKTWPLKSIYEEHIALKKGRHFLCWTLRYIIEKRKFVFRFFLFSLLFLGPSFAFYDIFTVALYDILYIYSWFYYILTFGVYDISIVGLYEIYIYSWFYYIYSWFYYILTVGVYDISIVGLYEIYIYSWFYYIYSWFYYILTVGLDSWSIDSWSLRSHTHMSLDISFIYIRTHTHSGTV